MATIGPYPAYFSDPLWHALSEMRIEPEGAAVTFTEKLARERGWSRQKAEDVMGEYRRFLYLAATGQAPVSPSGSVDKAWHLHLTYSRHYWNVLCGEVLGRPLHHDPSSGGAAEDARHQDQYGATLKRYRETFGDEPPAQIWPDGALRSRRVPRLAVLAGGAASLLLAACAGANGGNEALGWFPLIFVGAIFLIIVIAFASRGTHKGKRDGGDCSGGSCGGGSSDTSYDSGSSDSGGSSCGGGGCGGGGD